MTLNCTVRSLIAAVALMASTLPAPSAVMAGQPSAFEATSASQAGDDDLARVKAAGKIVVGTSADYEPFDFYSSNFALDGFDIVLMRELGRRMGVEVEFNDFAFDGLLDALNLKQVDAAIAAISVVPERQQKFDFSNLYYFGSDAVIGRTNYQGKVSSAHDMAGKKLGVERGSTYEDWAQSNLVDAGLSMQSDIVTYQDVNAMVRDVRNGKLDLALAGTLAMRAVVRRSAGTLKIVGEGTNTQQFGIATRKSSTLVKELNRALLVVQSDGTFARLAQQYLSATASEIRPTNPNVSNPPPTDPGGATQLPECVFGMQFVADLNYDDRNMTAPPAVKPSERFTKSWRVRNNGTCDWAPDFALAFTRGNVPAAQMGGTAVSVGRTVRPGETIDISANLQSPPGYGTFQGFWQMRTPQFNYFGETLWVGVTVPDPNPPPPPPTTSIRPNLRADADNLNRGQCTTVRWEVDNIRAAYFIDPNANNGNPAGVGGRDSRNVCPPGTTTYTLRIQRRDNVTQEFPITIHIVGQQPTLNFWVDNSTVNAGQCTTLRWDVQNVSAVYLNDQGTAGVGAQQICPPQTSTYTLRVTLRDGSTQTRQITVNVNPVVQPGPSITGFSSSANTISLRGCVELRWSAANATGTRINRNGQAIAAGAQGQGTLQDCPPVAGIAEYVLTAFGNGSASAKLTVNVLGPGPQPPAGPPPSERNP